MDAITCKLANPSANEQYFDSEFHEISHNVRNPLNAINGFAELLLMDGELSPLAADYVRAIVSSSQTLTQALVSHLDRVEEHDCAASAPAQKVSSEAQPLPRRAMFKHTRRSVERRSFRRQNPSVTP